ncbi:MAG TPA: 4-phosphoerythronate dehydrogenase PdxB [Victivallales bacterium]|nr:4-phosphoerythronate dehydrogenase PdxB [Victivallales bacterium]
MKFVVDEKIPFLKGVLETAGAEVLYLSGAKICRRDLIDADGIIVRTRTNCGESILEGTKVKFIATATIGFDHIDTEYCDSKGIYWTNAPGCNSSSVAQYICSALLNWSDSRGVDINGAAIGIIGVGNVGSKVAKVADALGMKVLLNDPPRQRKEGGDFVSIEKILHDADVITLHVPLQDEGTDKTYHMADDNFFREIRRKALFVNSSRGEVVDSSALKRAIKDGIIRDAIIDVWEDEPDIDRELLALAKFATPHIAGYSTDGKANGTAMSVRAASKFFKLGLDGWFPEGVPLPSQTKIDVSDTESWASILKAVNFSYDIKRDDKSLRSSPSDFEKLRGSYPLRREFPSFSVVSDSEDDRVRKIFNKLGFILNCVQRDSKPR